MSDKAHTTNQLLIGAIRQFKHNDGSDGFVIAYDKDEVDRVFEQIITNKSKTHKKKVQFKDY